MGSGLELELLSHDLVFCVERMDSRVVHLGIAVLSIAYNLLVFCVSIVRVTPLVPA